MSSFDDASQGVDLLCERFTSLLQNFQSEEGKRKHLEQKLEVLAKEKAEAEENAVRKRVQLETELAILKEKCQGAEREIVGREAEKREVQRMLVGCEAEKAGVERGMAEVGNRGGGWRRRGGVVG